MVIIIRYFYIDSLLNWTLFNIFNNFAEISNFCQILSYFRFETEGNNIFMNASKIAQITHSTPHNSLNVCI